MFGRATIRLGIGPHSSSVCLSDIFIPYERAILLVKCDFSYSCAAADKILTDLRARSVSLRQLSYLYF